MRSTDLFLFFDSFPSVLRWDPFRNELFSDSILIVVWEKKEKLGYDFDCYGLILKSLTVAETEGALRN